MWVETLSWEPRVFLYHNFLTLQECEHIISLGRPTLVKSTVIDNETGRSVDSRCLPHSLANSRRTPHPPHARILSLPHSLPHLHLPEADSLLLCSVSGAMYIVFRCQ